MGSSCLNDPAAAFLGLANNCNPSDSLTSLSISNTALGIYTSPRTQRYGIGSVSSRGMLLMVFRFSVTSSPTNPSPRVAPLTNLPSRYIKETESPSILGSTEYSASPRMASVLVMKSASPSYENTSVRLPICTVCVNFSNLSSALPPTRFVGDVGESNSGYAASRSPSSLNIASYS